jgi:type IV secretion system protein VirD4
MHDNLVRNCLRLATGIAAGGAAMAVAATFPWLLLAAFYVLYRQRGKLTDLWKHGTARTATRSELQGMVNADEGLIIGELEGRPSWREKIAGLFDPRLSDREAVARVFNEREIVRLKDAVHVCVCAPTRAGKGASLCVPFLKTLKPTESCLVLDFKPELAALVAEDMAARGFEIILLDPCKLLKNKLPFPTHTLNFLDFTHTVNEYRALAKELVPRDGETGGNSMHFLDLAEMTIASVIALTCAYAPGEDRSLQRVQEILSNPEHTQQAIHLMRKTGGFLGRMGGQLSFLQGDEASGVGTTTSRKMEWLNNPEMMESTQKTSFDLKRLRHGGMAIFLIPGGIEFARVLSPWVRASIGTIVRTIMRQPLGESHKIHCIFDEAVMLSHMDVCDDLLDKGAGWGFRCQWYIQNLQMVSKNFPNQEQTFLSNVTQIFFAVNDMQQQQGRGTADYISARGGNQTLLIESKQTSSGGSTSWSEGKDSQKNTGTNWGRSTTVSEHQRLLWTPDEVLASDRRRCFCFMAGMRPVVTRLIRWYEEPELMNGEPPARPQTLLMAWVLLMAACLGTLLATKAALPRPVHTTPYTHRPLTKGKGNESGPATRVRAAGQIPNRNASPERRP